MLVLTRKEREIVVLRDINGQNIANVRICRIMGDSVSIGFDAPDWVKIYRNEIDPGCDGAHHVRER